MTPIPILLNVNAKQLGVSKIPSGSLDSSTSSEASNSPSPKHIFRKGGESRFPFGFLKRRFTEGSLKKTFSSNVVSVRPSPEEATKWAKSFHELMNSKYGQALFKVFLQREFNDENLEFWIRIEDFRKTKGHKLSSKAQKIYNEFILPESPKEVNLDSVTRDNLINLMSQTPSHKIFDQAQMKVQNLLESDAYMRFLKSELYLELVYPEIYQEPVLSCSY